MEEIVLGGGCFWCIEGASQALGGLNATSGYSGGHVSNPSYEQVCGKKTGHAEVVKVVYDPQKIDLRSILRVFFTLHDPTQVDRQEMMSDPNIDPAYSTQIGPSGDYP